MNIVEQNFQKRLAVFQLLGTGISAIGAIFVTYGLTLLLFSSQLGIDSLQTSDEEIKENLTIFSKLSSNSGWTYVYGGLILLIGGLVGMCLVIATEKVKHKEKRSSKIKILFDEMYDGKDLELKDKGYDVYSVKKLRLEGKPLRYDYSVLNYVKDNNMILITEDPENIGGCKENNLPCIGLGQNPSVEDIVKELERLKNNDFKIS